MGSGLILIGDLRNLPFQAWKGNWFDAGLTLIAVAPVIGDAESIGVKIFKFVGKHLTKLGDVVRFIAKIPAEKFLPSGKIHLFDKAYEAAGKGTSIATNLLNKGISEKMIAKVAANGADLSDTKNIIKDILNRERWLQIGSDFKGWLHGKGRHVDGTLKTNVYTSFFPIGQTIVRDVSKTLPPKMTINQVEELVYEATKFGIAQHKVINGYEVIEYVYKPQKFGIDEMIVRSNLDGEIFTFFPTKGPDVWVWNPALLQADKWVNVI